MENEIIAGSAPEAQTCDIVVIGGGPAGSSISALLAERGYQVTLLEKAQHPRFHIGESLLPASLPLLQELGVAEEVRSIGMEKWGAEFNSPYHAKKKQSFSFGDGWDKSIPMAYQVRRSEFDEILIRNAARKGATVIEGCRASAVEFLPDDAGVLVHAQHEEGRENIWQARFLVDASGRDTFLGNRFKYKRRNSKHNGSALYAHYRGAQRLDGREEGDISVFWFEHGWFWFIPLADGTTSIGAVMWPHYLKSRNKPINEFFQDTIEMSPALAARLVNAERTTEVAATGNYSYACTQTHGRNYLLVGDAFAFIDPFFSSGVMLAMQGAFIGAEAVDTCLRDPKHAPEALKKFDRQVRHGTKMFSWFIYRISQPNMRDMFMNPGNIFRAKEAVISVLAGDIFGKTPIWSSLAIFKGIYYLSCLRHPYRSWAAWRQRKEYVRVQQ